ncbi:MAG: BamA/TamA family outer membrane protein [Bacteroidota bacterium]
MIKNRSRGTRHFFTLIAFILFNWQIAAGQILKKTVDWVRYHSVVDTTTPGQPSFRLYPTLAYSPETDLEIGFSMVYLFQAKKDTVNRISEINSFTFITLQKQYGIWLDNAIYGHQDKWFVLGRTRFQKYPLLYYGIGPATSKKYPATIDATSFVLRQRVLRKIIPNLFVGPEIDYQNLFNTRVEHDEADLVKEVPLGSEGSSNIGVGTAIVYDNRHNVLNVRKGYFAELGFLHYSDKLGSKYRFTGINTDLRAYYPVNKRNVLAWQVTGNFFTGNVPFNQMALIGGETIMRGYYFGRYRDKNMIAAQTEYRLLPLSFSKRIGAAVFASAAVLGPRINKLELENVKFAAGAGLRYLLFPKKDIYVRFDLGVTREGIGFYFFTGESF